MSASGSGSAPSAGAGAAAGASAWGSNKGPPSSVLQEAARGSAGSGSGRGASGGGSGGRGAAGRGNSNSNKSGGGRGGGGGGRGGGGGGGRGRGDRNNNSMNKNNNDHKNKNSGGGGGGGGKNHHNNNKNDHSGGKNDHGNKGGGGGGGNKTRSKALEEIELWNTTGSGETAAHKAVFRVSCAKFLSCRLQYLEEPENVPTGDADATTPTPTLEYTPHKNCHWTAEDRIAMIQTQQEALWNYKPLEVNDDTRWKAKVMLADTDGGGATGGADDAQMSVAERDAEQLRKAIAILNKLSWTTLHKLTIKFLETIGATTPAAADVTTTPTTNDPAQPAAVLSKQVVQDCMTMIVDKAMTEPHFAELYARFCFKLASVHKTFKKTLLAICQDQFEETDKEPELPADMDPAEKKYQLGFSKRKSIGLMQFIGELYKMKLIKGGIMIGCLQRLLVHDDEEQLECFAKLMTTIGQRLEDYDEEPEMIALWKQIYQLAGKEPGGPVAPGNRIKFLLIDLIELKQNGWVERRVVEKATTIAQIQKNADREEQMAGQQGGGGRPPPKYNRSQSGGNAIKQSAPPPVADNDGFMQVGTAKPKKQPPLKRAQSDGAAVGTSSLQRAMSGASKPFEPATAPISVQAPISEFLEPQECGQKMKSILKEYFVGGDTGDAILTIEEVVGKGHEGHVERGAGMIEGGILQVLEMKESEVRKFLVIMSKSLKEEKINKSSIPLGLSNPLEFLRDVEIDAPLASSLLAIVIAEWINMGLLSLDFLLKCPEYFRSDGRPADFAVQIISKRGSGVTDADIEIVSSLMNDEDKKAHPVVKEWVEATCK
jgi:hypothetical protein